MYEIFVRSFADSNGDGIGDLKGITQKLDYLKNLGVGVLWLTPIFASPSYHGYDTTDYYKIHPDFGTEADLVELVQQAHQRNIRIMLDYVVAHTSNHHPLFEDAWVNLKSPYSDFYVWKDDQHIGYESFSGVSSMPRVNFASAKTQQYFIDVAKYWMTKTGNGAPKQGIDGLRADYALNPPHDFWKNLRTQLKALNPNFELLAEAWTNPTNIAPYFDNEFDAAFNFPLYEDIQASPDNTGDGMLVGTGFTGQFAADNLIPFVLYPSGSQVVNFINNHDTNRVMSEVNGNIDRAKLGAMLLLTLPGTPMLYYGEEIGMSGIKAPGPDYDMTRREPMDWYANETGAGMAQWYKPATRFNKPNDGVSVEEQQGKANSLLELYRSLIAFRTQTDALRHGDFVPITMQGPDNIIAYARAGKSETIVVVLNPLEISADITLDLSTVAPGKVILGDAFSQLRWDSALAAIYPLHLGPRSGYIFKLYPQ